MLFKKNNLICKESSDPKVKQVAMERFTQFLSRAEEISSVLEKDLVSVDTILQLEDVKISQIFPDSHQESVVASGPLFFLKEKNSKSKGDFFFLSIQEFQFPLDKSTTPPLFSSYFSSFFFRKKFLFSRLMRTL